MADAALPHLGSAAAYAVRALPLATPTDNVADVRARLTVQRFDAVDWLYVVNGDRRFAGVVALADAMAAPADRSIADLMRPVPSVRPSDDQADALALAWRHNLTAVPVVDLHGILVGAVPAAGLLDIGRREHEEDLSRLAGIMHETDHGHASDRALTDAPWRRARRRLPWLLVGVVGAVLATAVVTRFEAALAGYVAIAFFIPAIVYLADAVGTQTETVVVRGLAAHDLPLGRLLAGEIATGALLGTVLGLVALAAIWLVFDDFRLAGAVALTIVAASGVAAACGLLLPWALDRLGFDPAFGSGPVATVIQDVLSLLIYFSVLAAWL
jgi:magnesium transporter